MALKQMIGVGDICHQLGKKVLEALMDHGGTGDHVTLLNDTRGQEHFAHLAQAAIGGPWMLFGKTVHVPMDWETPIAELQRRCDRVSINATIYSDGPGSLVFPEPESPPEGVIGYTLHHLRRTTSDLEMLESFAQWRHTCYRELLQFVNVVKTGRCGIISLGWPKHGSEGGVTYPSYTEFADGRSSIDWSGRAEGKELTLDTSSFVLLRVFG